MMKKIKSYIKLQICAGMANPSPPVGPALGQRGVNIMEFCKEFNAKTSNLEKGLAVPVIITVYVDRSFTFIIKTPPASILLKKALGITTETKKSKEKIFIVKRSQIRDIAQVKATDMTGANIEAVARSIEGTAKSMGLKVEE